MFCFAGNRHYQPQKKRQEEKPAVAENAPILCPFAAAKAWVRACIWFCPDIFFLAPRFRKQQKKMMREHPAAVSGRLNQHALRAASAPLMELRRRFQLNLTTVSNFETKNEGAPCAAHMTWPKLRRGPLLSDFPFQRGSEIGFRRRFF